MPNVGQLLRVLGLEDLVKQKFLKAATEKSKRATRLRWQEAGPLAPPELKKAPTTTSEEIMTRPLKKAGPQVDISTKWPGRTPIMSPEGQQHLQALLRVLGEEKGKVASRRRVPMLLHRPQHEPVQFITTVEEAKELVAKNPKRYKYATTPTGGPPVRMAHVGPEGWSEYRELDVRSIVPKLKREATKTGKEVGGIEPPVRRAKLIKAPTKDDLAWDNVKTIPGESAWWRNVMTGSKGRFKGSTADFFKKQYYQFRTDPFGFVKKQGTERMAQKFSVYKDLGLLQ